MRRRCRAGDKRAKSRPKSPTLKHRNAPKAMRNCGVSIAGRKTVVPRLTREHDLKVALQNFAGVDRARKRKLSLKPRPLLHAMAYPTHSRLMQADNLAHHTTEPLPRPPKDDPPRLAAYA